MKKVLGISIALAFAPAAQAADIEAGRAKVATVCAACHGAAGVSVSDNVPNLAAQRAGYLAAQLKALKEGTRKNPIMNAIAAQLSAEDIANVAAFFAAQPGAASGAKSAQLPNVAKTSVTFPDLLAEVYAAKLDANKNPVKGGDGFFEAEKLIFYTAMASGAGWGRDVPEMLRNGDWNYAVFTTDKQHRPGVNQAECFACHKPLDKTSYVFTLKQLGEVK
ncbi:MAG: c-type cytochrome [Betaproteobacteria bacterium]|nr:c-type cytochrome [Betaproteobacteria bacterium]